jgi:uncharacterized repeat protein (TIGR03803 family)
MMLLVLRPPKLVPVWCPNRAMKEILPMNAKQNLFSAKPMIALIAILTVAGSVLAVGQSESVIYRFKDPSDGSNPAGGLISDSVGNFYGTTLSGGTSGNGGTAFKLTQRDGPWTKTVLYSFTGGSDGASPQGNLIFDQAGNLYGTTAFGGSSSCADGCGAVFRLAPAQGGWTMTAIYKFQGGTTDGQIPVGGLVFDKAGNLYGTTFYGGKPSCRDGCGTAFQLTPLQGGNWTESVIHFFGSEHDGAANPAAGLIIDGKGDLFGTTQYGGSAGHGTVFKLDSPTTQGGAWIEHVLHNFQETPDGSEPSAALIFDQKGNLDGTTTGGGASGYGAVFQLIRGQDGGWTENVLYSFCSESNCVDGGLPLASLVFGDSDKLYSTTSSGGSTGWGTVFQLTPPATQGGIWTETVLWSFAKGKDGSQPFAGLTLGKFSVLYGTTFYGGKEGGNCTLNFGCGTVFRVKP